MILSAALSPGDTRFYDSDTDRQLWEGLDVESATMRYSAESTDSPQQFDNMEDSAVVANDMQAAKVIMPTSITVSAIATSADAFLRVMSAFKNDTLTVNVISRSIMVSNMGIAKVSAAAGSEMVNGFSITIELVEIFPSEAFVTKSPAQAADASGARSGDAALSKVPKSIGAATSDALAKIIKGRI